VPYDFGTVAFILSERDTEFVSKVNKSVVTVRRGNFMNFVSGSPGIYSCAVDAFLEISTYLFPPY